jgi:leader peptidase (prepilin peptidase) / N-methyltransferase
LINLPLLIFILFVLGTVVGSFLNVAIWRWPRGEKADGRSHCPSCNKTLTARQLVPLISFLWQRGRCHYCAKRISGRYIIIEGVTGLLFAAAGWYLNPVEAVDYVILLRWLFVLAILVCVFVIDLEHYLILDKIIFPAAAIVLLLNIGIDLLLFNSNFPVFGYTGGGLFAAAIASGFFYLIWLVSRGQWMGFGDVKFNVLLGLVIGWPLAIIALFLAFFLGALVGVVLMVFGGKQLGSRIPFGTFLSLAMVITMFFGPSIMVWYLGLIGWS